MVNDPFTLADWLRFCNTLPASRLMPNRSVWANSTRSSCAPRKIYVAVDLICAQARSRFGERYGSPPAVVLYWETTHPDRIDAAEADLLSVAL